MFDLLKFKPSVRMGKNGDSRGTVGGARRAGLRVSETADLLGFFTHNHL